jgi:hypothetical protein
MRACEVLLLKHLPKPPRGQVAADPSANHDLHHSK